MKKILALCAALLASGLFVNEAAAQGPPPGMPQGQGGFTPTPYGWHPKIQGVFGSRCTDRCGKPTLFGKLFCKTRGGEAPNAEGGTLVYPNHQYARSPRDFFMMDQ